MTTSKAGYLGKVTIGTGTVLGVGNWNMDGSSVAELDDTEFGDTSTKYVLGIEDGGTISFAGLHKPGDTTGQAIILNAKNLRTELTDLRFYIDNTSFYRPCSSTGYLHPTKVSGANTVLSNFIITSDPVTYDKGGLGQISFTARVNGNMVLE